MEIMLQKGDETLKFYELRIKLTRDHDIHLTSCEGVYVDECITKMTTKDVPLNQESYEKIKIFLEGSLKAINKCIDPK